MPAPREAFDPRRPLVVVRPFIAGGRPYANGEAFDTRRMAISQRRLKQLFEQRYLGHPEDDDQEDTDEQAQDLGGYSIEETGNGWCDVRDADGNQVNGKKLRRHEAEMLIESLLEGKDPGA